MFQFHHQLQAQIPAFMVELEQQASFDPGEDFMDLSSKKDGFFLAEEPNSVLDLGAHISPLNSPTTTTSSASSSIFHSSSRNSGSQSPSSNLGRSSWSSSIGDPIIDAFEAELASLIGEEQAQAKDDHATQMLNDIDFDFGLESELLNYATSCSSSDMSHEDLEPQSQNQQLFAAKSAAAEQDHLVLDEMLQQQDDDYALAPPQSYELAIQAEEENGLQIVHMLLACVESIQQGDHESARMILSSLASSAATSGAALGSPLERVSTYIASALSERINKVALFDAANKKPRKIKTTKGMTMNTELEEAAHCAFYKHFPFLKFAHFTANHAILDSLRGDHSRIHIVDLDIGQGLQWPNLIQILADTATTTATAPPSLRLTGVGADLDSVKQTGIRLRDFAQSLGVPFEFDPVLAESADLIDPSSFRIRDDEALAVSCSMVLHRLLGNQPALESILFMLRSWKPSIVTVSEVEANQNTPAFIDRFVEALHFYSAVFDSIECTLDRADPERLSIESCYFGAEIRNILSCEGAERIVRHARSDHWKDCMRWSGFKDLPLSDAAIYQAQIFLTLYYSPEYRISRDGLALILGWHDTPVVSVSTWSC